MSKAKQPSPAAPADQSILRQVEAHPAVEFVEDERAEGRGIAVGLRPGLKYRGDPDHYLFRRFSRAEDALAVVNKEVVDRGGGNSVNLGNGISMKFVERGAQ